MTTVGLLVLAISVVALQKPPISPEVHPDRSVTFRLVDPGATKVELGLEGADSVPMTRDGNGVWSYTTGPLAPDIYGYSFNADGQTRLDPQNPSMVKPNLVWSGNMVLVPGDPAEPWERQNVPHGILHHHFYHSGVVGDDRDYFVYTPPGYKATARKKYPVLYLLHGYSDIANGWTEVGKANEILDNLIAQGRAKPMLVVMTFGYGVPGYASPNGGNRGPDVEKKNYDNYRESLLKEVVPAVESDYRVKTDKADRAIAGLSMGGAETLYVGLNNLDTFSYVGAFSSGGLRDIETSFPGFDGAKANEKLKLLWVSCGTEDGLIRFNRTLVKWLKAKNANLQALETPGRHTWMVWRRNLIAFSQQLFR